MDTQLEELTSGFSCYVGGVEEAHFIYREIFEDKCYDIVELPERPFIIDVGANIGLFCLYMKQKYPSSRILAFEPAPPTYATLRQNLELHNISGVEAHQCALGSKTTIETLTYYPNAPGNSTFSPKEKEAFAKVAVEKLGQERLDRFFQGASEISVPIKRLSYFLDDHRSLTSIDLLKIDVEGAELEVLGGVDDAHWTMIRNVVMEFCDLSGPVDEVECLLQSKGFIVATEVADFGIKGATWYMVTGRRISLALS
jgi:FkbM family methyltransferase